MAALPTVAMAVGETGHDVSYPQCNGTAMAVGTPAAGSFGIVGLNGGRTGSSNDCAAAELSWANTGTVTTTQNAVQLYVNTGNPGDVLRQAKVTDWPANNIDPAGASEALTDPYGACSGTYTNNQACGWQYGYNHGIDDLRRLLTADPAGLMVTSPAMWWLDVETANSWSRKPANNQAVLEGMATALGWADKVGIYSTPTMWGKIVGTSAPMINRQTPSPLQGLPSWLPGAANATQAAAYCHNAPLVTGGKVSLTQFTTTIDIDYNCL
jgi:hypothetical protein